MQACSFSKPAGLSLKASPTNPPIPPSLPPPLTASGASQHAACVPLSAGRTQHHMASGRCPAARAAACRAYERRGGAAERAYAQAGCSQLLPPEGGRPLRRAGFHSGVRNNDGRYTPLSRRTQQAETGRGAPVGRGAAGVVTVATSSCRCACQREGCRPAYGTTPSVAVPKVRTTKAEEACSLGSAWAQRGAPRVRRGSVSSLPTK
eukprot:357845-Chlamydomonas_euryale.AAC.2